jgi:hypothetical protein
VARASTRIIQTADGAPSVTTMRRGAGESRRWDAARLEAAWLEFDAQMRRFEHAKARLRATIEQQRNGRPQREILHDSAFARLQARMESMPVIE